MRLTWLPDLLRQHGVQVVEVDGWATRGRELPQLPHVVIGHHTAGPKPPTGGEIPSLATLVNGRPDLPGPLCQIGLSRSGVAYVIASGKANHAGAGAWAGISDSWLTIGIEAEHPGDGITPWTDEQLDAYDHTAAALLDGINQPADMYCGHKEWARPAGRKIDPRGIDLPAQRRRIHLLLTQPPPGEDDDMKHLLAKPLAGSTTWYVVAADLGHRTPIGSGPDLQALRGLGYVEVTFSAKQLESIPVVEAK